MNMLVGYTGFVGSNIYRNGEFELFYNSKNIKESYGKKPELLVYSGMRAEKFLANKDPENDMNLVKEAMNNIKMIDPKTIVLISTIDVYKNPQDVTEGSEIDTDGLLPYGANRYYLEKWVEENFEKYLIVRLPGLYGVNIKKNFIYDFIHRIPSMLTEEKISEIINNKKDILEFYTKLDNGFYKCKDLSNEERAELRGFFEKNSFSALNFTDSRGVFQFYNLKYLWSHINVALDNNIKYLNLATEPISISELYSHVTEGEFVNEVSKEVPFYNFKTEYAETFGGEDGYIFNKKFVLDDIKNFILEFEVK